MAVDTLRKRASCFLGLPFRITLPLADGSLDQGDRQHLCGCYAGILASSGVTPVYPVIFDTIYLTAVVAESIRFDGTQLDTVDFEAVKVEAVAWNQ